RATRGSDSKMPAPVRSSTRNTGIVFCNCERRCNLQRTEERYDAGNVRQFSGNDRATFPVLYGVSTCSVFPTCTAMLRKLILPGRWPAFSWPAAGCLWVSDSHLREALPRVQTSD